MIVLIVSRGYPTATSPMNGIFEMDQAKALASRDHIVIYAVVNICTPKRSLRWTYGNHIVDKVNIEEIAIPLNTAFKPLRGIIKIIGLKDLYKRIVTKYGKPDIIHAHFTSVAYYTIKALKNSNIPIIMTEHSSKISDNNIKKYLYLLANSVYKNVNRIIAVSPSLKLRIENTYKVKAEYIPNIVDLKIFQYFDRNNSNAKKTVIVSTGNLIKRKRMDLLIEQFAELYKLFPESRLVIIGDGPERSKLEEMVVRFGLKDAVELKGRCDRSEIAAELGNAAFFVLVSRNETFGVSYIEALACGVPVIATKCGGPDVFVNENNGILIPVDDKEKLFYAMKYLFINNENYNRKNISINIINNYSPDIIAKKIEDIYSNVSESKKLK